MLLRGACSVLLHSDPRCHVDKARVACWRTKTPWPSHTPSPSQQLPNPGHMREAIQTQELTFQLTTDTEGNPQPSPAPRRVD